MFEESFFIESVDMAKKTKATRKGGGKTITKAIAAKWMKDSDSVDLAAFQQLDEDAAKVLAKHDGILELNGLTQISDGAAKAIASFKGFLLEINGLSYVPETVARNLAKTKAGLWLNGLKELSEETAKALSKTKAGLQLNGLKELSEETAKALSTHPGTLKLCGLKKCSDNAAKYLALLKDDLEIGILSLSDNAAKAFASFSSSLTLSGIRRLSDAAAQSLEPLDHDGRLELSDNFCETIARLKVLCPAWNGLLRFAGWTLVEKEVKRKDIPKKISRLLPAPPKNRIDSIGVVYWKVTLRSNDGESKDEDYYVGEFGDEDSQYQVVYVVNNIGIVAEFEDS